MEKVPDHTSPHMSRRSFLAGGAALAAGSAMPETARAALSQTYESADSMAERIPDGNEEFLLQVVGHIAVIKMRDEVCFIDTETGAPVGNVKEAYVDGINPGKGWSETTRVAEGYDGRWMEAARELVAARTNTDPEKLQIRTNYKEINAAVNDPDENMTYENTESIADIVDYFGSKPVRGAEDYSRIDYVREKVMFSESVPRATQRQLRFLLPGLIAKESRFNDDVSSNKNALGLTQFLPSTVAGLGGYEEYVIYEDQVEELADGSTRSKRVETGLHTVPMTVQVEMLGTHFDNINREIHTSEISKLLEEHFVPLFASRQEYEEMFLTLIMVNAYNPGAGRIRSAIRNIVESGTLAEYARTHAGNRGYDIFNLVAEAAYESGEGSLDAYGEQSRDYVEKVFAHAVRIERNRAATTESVDNQSDAPQDQRG